MLRNRRSDAYIVVFFETSRNSDSRCTRFDDCDIDVHTHSEEHCLLITRIDDRKALSTSRSSVITDKCIIPVKIHQAETYAAKWIVVLTR
ncbi:hypothetical protein AVEN_61772-1 [Araneus ventricosus]|uniref:Uncharacterized protein n=1 Tax=Araneus ventricosus TaxID=182803 RepID=A0A4Y2V6C9_ARAVE|nr:hypothetical protein AVEN_61772-1 [Araneus ventricosus]